MANSIYSYYGFFEIRELILSIDLNNSAVAYKILRKLNKRLRRTSNFIYQETHSLSEIYDRINEMVDLINNRSNVTKPSRFSLAYLFTGELATKDNYKNEELWEKVHLNIKLLNDHLSRYEYIESEVDGLANEVINLKKELLNIVDSIKIKGTFKDLMSQFDSIKTLATNQKIIINEFLSSQQENLNIT